MLKIDIDSIDRENFMVHPHVIAGEVCYLVQPIHIGATWTRDNLMFRSSVWNKDGYPVSLSFPKFFNWGEKPELAPLPSAIDKNVNLIEKIDGSTLIVSKYKGELIVRTRGTVDASKLDNGYEIEVLKQKYPEVFAFDLEGDLFNGTIPYSFIYEWTSPTNRIVIDYGSEPKLYLTGIISHTTGELARQNTLDLTAEQELRVPRPKRFNFSSTDEMLNGVAALKDQEGLCVYYNNDQNILKVKSASYLAAHRLKSELGSFDKLIDFYFTCGSPNYADFKAKIESLTDFELFTQIQGDVSRICDGMKEVKKILDAMADFVYPLRQMTRKDAALIILQAYGKTSRSGIAFKLLDDKELDMDDYKKLLYQVLKS